MISRRPEAPTAISDSSKDDCGQVESAIDQPSPWKIRFMCGYDVIRVADIEQEAFDCPWSHAEINDTRKREDVVGRVAINGNGVVVGYAFVSMQDDRLALLSLAVCKQWRFCGIGRQLLEDVQAKLDPTGRSFCEMMVCERNVPAQLWLRECGLKAMKVVRNYFKADDRQYRDGYRFVMWPKG